MQIHSHDIQSIYGYASVLINIVHNVYLRHVPCGLVARIWRFHRRGRGSIPRKGVLLDVVSLHLCLLSLFVLVCDNVMKSKCHSSALILTTDRFRCNTHFAGLAMTSGIVQLRLGIKY